MNIYEIYQNSEHLRLILQSYNQYRIRLETAMEKNKKVRNKTKINVFLDILLALIFIVELEEHFTGLSLHELLGLLFSTAFLIHIVLHWGWIVAVTRGFFKQILHESRLNYVLNIALLITVMFTAVSGILISRTLGLNFNVDHSWEQIHKIAAELSLIVVALHVAMHWKWIAQNGRKYLFGWIPKLSQRNKPQLAPQTIQNMTQTQES